MSLLRNLERAEQIHRLIHFKRTGPPEEFAAKMGMSLSTLFALLKELRALGAPIGYCRSRRSYRYTRPVDFHCGFRSTELPKAELRRVEAAGRVVPLWREGPRRA